MAAGTALSAAQVAQPSSGPIKPVELFVLFVAPDGNDGWSGRLAQRTPDGRDGPLATVPAAVEAARKAGAGRPRRIVLLGGVHFLARPIELDPQDAGLAIEGAGAERPRLCGGRRITGWKRDGERFWSADLPDVSAGRWDFRVLIVNGRSCPRARMPEKGVFQHLSRFDVPWMSTTGGGWKRKPTAQELTTMKCRPRDLPPGLDIRNAELTVYHMWDESLVGLLRREGGDVGDANACTLTFSNPAGHPPGAFGVRDYVVWNTREGMTRPGQWYLDRTRGKVVYWPPDGEDMSAAEVLAPTIETIIRIRGDQKQQQQKQQQGNPARDITIRSLCLMVTNTPLKAGGFGAFGFDGAVSITRAENIRLIDLEVVHAGGYGVKAADLRDGGIKGLHIHHAGAGGMIVGGDGTAITNCHIHDVGLTYPSAIGLNVRGKDGRGILVAHNEIHDVPYSAITGSGLNHRVEGNLIHRAMLKLHDGAGIYFTFCKGCVWRGNFIRDIPDTGGYGSSAYYLDEQAEDCLVEGNLSVGVARPLHCHMARNNTIRNNVFVTDGDARLTFPRCTGHVLERNIISAAGGITFDNPDAIASLRDNVLFSAKGKLVGHVLKDYARAGSQPVDVDRSSGNILADPQIVQDRPGRIRFAEQSPAHRLGIRPLDVSAAGPDLTGKTGTGRAESR